MAVPPRPRDSRLIDALEAFTHESFEAAVWRVVREGRDPTQCSAAGGRWDDRTFDVLYTSLDRDGAIAEMHFHLMRGQPVFPSRVGYGLYALKARLKAMLRLPTLDALGKLGLDAARYGQLTYNERNAEYPRPQEIAEVAHFLDCDGILVPSARWPCANLVLFCDRLPPDAIEVGHDHGLIDWRR
ncbi:MAG: RES family NAD+ phosphorylase [Stellaceae bacterium]